MFRSWRRVRTALLVSAYSVVLFMGFDSIYSAFFYERPPSPRVKTPQYSHGLLPNFDGFDTWAYRRYRFVTNDLGFRDSNVRAVPARSAVRRVLLIGDSFTEGVGVTFEQSFSGLLDEAGRQHATEFLNAGVVSYSPVIYFRKIEWLIRCGLEFNEVVVFSDLSDVNDEATSHFDLHAEPASAVDCRSFGTPRRRTNPRFVVTRGTSGMIEHYYRQITGQTRDFQFRLNHRPAWTLPEFDVGDSYAPLGLEGGIERSLQNMQRLADLLSGHKIPLTIVVYPWPMQLAQNDRESRQVLIWRSFCTHNCERFIDTFPEFFAVRDADSGWYRRLYIPGDCHFSPEGHRLVYEAARQHLL